MTASFDASRTTLPRAYQSTAADLCAHNLSVTPEVTNHEVQNIFAQYRNLISLPVVENNRPIGLINRNIFMSQVSKPFHQEIYGRKSCIAFMDKNPLTVDAGLSIEDLTFRAVESGEKTLADGFIITRNSEYIGIGVGMELMNVVANMQSEKNRQIMHSINYASVIQRAMLRTSRVGLQDTLEDAHLVWEPRDIVGGDFYHFASYQDGWFAAIADCTGHGVPGAFMTMIASSTLAQAIEKHGPRDPGLLLSAINSGIKQMLGQTNNSHDRPESDDGLDAALIWFDSTSRTLTFAGAKSAIYMLHPHSDAVVTIDGERMGVGYVDSPMDFIWSNQQVATKPGTLFFMTTDGLVDQIGGPKKISFGKTRIRNNLLACREAPAKTICEELLIDFNQWQGDEPRRDDLNCFCFRI